MKRREPTHAETDLYDLPHPPGRNLRRRDRQSDLRALLASEVSEGAIAIHLPLSFYLPMQYNLSTKASTIMPVTQTKEAAHIMAGNDPSLTENASAKMARKRMEAQRAAAALNAPQDAPLPKRADTTTPLVGKAPLATLPEPPAAPAKAARKFALSTTVDYRGRAITIQAEGMTLDQFCDLLDERDYRAPAPLVLSAPLATPDDLPDGYKLCRKHGAPMKPRSKQGDVWNSHNVGTADNPCWCKGYKGPDSPGYEVG